MCLQYYTQEWRVVVGDDLGPAWWGGGGGVTAGRGDGGDDLGPASMCGRACKQKGQKGNTQERRQPSRRTHRSDPKRRTHVQVQARLVLAQYTYYVQHAGKLSQAKGHSKAQEKAQLF